MASLVLGAALPQCPVPLPLVRSGLERLTRAACGSVSRVRAQAHTAQTCTARTAQLVHAPYSRALLVNDGGCIREERRSPPPPPPMRNWSGGGHFVVHRAGV